MDVWLIVSSNFHRYTIGLMHFGESPISILINLAILLFIVYLLVASIIRLRGLINPSNQVFLELEIPAFTTFSYEAYNDFFARVHGLLLERSLPEKLLLQRRYVSIEIDASSDTGVRFMVACPADQLKQIKRLIKVSLPGTLPKAIKQQKDILNTSRIYSFKLKKPYYIPLKTNLLGALAYQPAFMDMKEAERLTLQINLSAKNHRFNNKQLHKFLTNNRTRGLVPFVVRLLQGRPRLPLITEATKAKLDSDLFTADIRLVVQGHDVPSVDARARVFRSSLSVLANPGRQQLVKTVHPLRPLLIHEFINRVPGLINFNKPILSSGELVSLFHFPDSGSVGTEMMSTYKSRTLPITKSYKNRKNDVLIGENIHDGIVTPIGLTKDERSRHMYIIGGTGNGKTTMLEYMISQDIKNNKGVMVIDPHGDLADRLVKAVPRRRANDLIYFNPFDTINRLTINLLELPPNLTTKQYQLERDRITESIISVFRKTFEQNDEGSSYRIERLLRYAIQTALGIEGATLFTVSRILSDKNYRKRVLDHLQDEDLKRYWIEEFNKAGEYQRIKFNQGPLARLNRFETNTIVKQIVGSKTSTLNIDEAMNNNKIVICNLAKGLIGEDVSALLGSVLLAKVQLASLRRQLLLESKRSTFYLYVDEFQNYANTAFINMFSEARKFGLSLIMAQQSPAQLDNISVLDTIMDNVGTFVTFRSKSQTSEKLIMSQFLPVLTNHEIANLPKYHFFAKIYDADPPETISGRTVVFKPKGNISSIPSKKLIGKGRSKKALSKS
ncbi:MAG TPA: type IV secretion system DNA-binding domain-containing protein [Candidatus Saccharimonadales bacterium]|nr:type IV secretion system DNA-binding domain-containing protein [Candidatus Saccharimonadales bacterium]